MRLLTALFVCALVATACTSDPSAYDTDEVEAMRSEKDEQFKESNDSPLPEDRKSSFAGLSYFPPDADYAVTATFTESASPDTVLMQTSTVQVRKAVRAGVFSFTLNNKKLRLTAYTFIDFDSDDSYFVPFTDKTTGNETYYAGRYLDVPVTGDSEYELDFNMAYNPYCAYSDRFSCPRVPQENDLAVEIRAGEKK